VEVDWGRVEGEVCKIVGLRVDTSTIRMYISCVAFEAGCISDVPPRESFAAATWLSSDICICICLILLLLSAFVLEISINSLSVSWALHTVLHKTMYTLF
jgi:hypothetical protein